MNNRLMTQREFAKLKGVSERTIYNWKQNDWLVLDEESGLLDVAASNARLAANHSGGGTPAEYLREPQTHPSLVTLDINWLADELDGIVNAVWSAMKEAWHERYWHHPVEIRDIIEDKVRAIMSALE